MTACRPGEPHHKSSISQFVPEGSVGPRYQSGHAGGRTRAKRPGRTDHTPGRSRVFYSRRIEDENPRRSPAFA